jgi:hypothetical protein
MRPVVSRRQVCYFPARQNSISSHRIVPHREAWSGKPKRRSLQIKESEVSRYNICVQSQIIATYERLTRCPIFNDLRYLFNGRCPIFNDLRYPFQRPL